MNRLLLAEGLRNRAALAVARVPPALLQAERAARNRLAGAQRHAAKLAGANSAGLKVARAAVDAAYRELEVAIARIQRAARRVAEVVYARPAALEGVRARLPEDAALVSYWAAFVLLGRAD